MRRLVCAPLLVCLFLSGSGARELPGSAPARAATEALPVSHPARTAEGFPGDAVTLRGGDFDAAWRSLAELFDEPPPIGERARLVAGLYSYAHGRHESARELLRDVHGGDFEDWRLFALAESLTELGADPAAAAALDLLSVSTPGSPLADVARLRAVEWRRRRGDLAGALSGALDARENTSDEEIQERLDELAWDVAEELDDPSAKAVAARNLLVHQPLTASKRKVVELLRSPSGPVPWGELFSTDELLERCRNLLALGITEGALEALDAVAPADRDDRWTLLRSDALTEARRGVEALELLRDRPVADAPRRVDYLWRAAEAALDASVARSGRANLPSERRAALKLAAATDLDRIAVLGSDDDRVASLRRRYALLALDEDFEAALDVLRRLRELDPADRTGAEDLWKLGWQGYRSRNYTGSIGTWLELATLYPETRWARAGRYWSASAHARLGRMERANQLRQGLLLSDTEDFYARHARRALGSAAAPRTKDAAHAVDPWPDDPVLARARLLSDLGLDELAQVELYALEASADRTAVAGVRALILERLGDRRESIRSVARTFRGLGSAHQASVPLEARRMYYPLDFYDVVTGRSDSQRLSPYLVMAIIRQESAFDADAVSRSGARGLMQLMPATGRELAGKVGVSYSIERLHDPDLSVRLGTTYFRQVLDMFDGDVELALAGYNGGPYRIRRWWREAGGRVSIDEFIESLPLAETRGYVQRILLFADSYEQLYGRQG